MCRLFSVSMLTLTLILGQLTVSKLDCQVLRTQAVPCEDAHGNIYICP